MDLPPMTTPEGLFEYLVAFLLLAAVLAFLVLFVGAG
jgi:hypothetical protein